MIRQLEPTELAELLASGESIYLLDVRQPFEREFAVLKDDTAIPLDELPARLEEISPPEGAMVVVYCHHGIRSLTAAAFLEQSGFPLVGSLSGGIDAWSAQVDSSVSTY